MADMTYVFVMSTVGNCGSFVSAQYNTVPNDLANNDKLSAVPVNCLPARLMSAIFAER